MSGEIREQYANLCGEKLSSMTGYQNIFETSCQVSVRCLK